MIETWYGVVSFMLITCIVLDGRNFGAGMLHWLVAKTPDEGPGHRDDRPPLVLA
jgi:cytochrome bd-type quinol oxidase subunit 2